MEHEVLAETRRRRLRASRWRSATRSRRASCCSCSSPAPGTARRRAPRAEQPRRRTASAPICGRCASATRSDSTPRAPEAVARRHERGRRTARENLADLLDEGSFVEYGPLLFAAQERRRSREELIARTPADGLVGGVGEVDGRRCVAMSYDYTVLAGTQGMRNHIKKDRLFEIAERRAAAGRAVRRGRRRAPRRRRHADRRRASTAARSSCSPQLSGLVPLVGIASGYCFAGNAALLGCCDVVIATEDSSIGMGGPAMIEGGGLGVYEPGEVGPIDVQHANGVVDLRVADDARGGGGRQALPLLLPRAARAGAGARPGAAARR